MGVWAYSCILGLAQGTCGAREPDEKSRGYGRLGGCPSCKYRKPYDAETELADFQWVSRKVGRTA